jgi:hypothetical protein
MLRTDFVDRHKRDTSHSEYFFYKSCFFEIIKEKIFMLLSLYNKILWNNNNQYCRKD